MTWFCCFISRISKEVSLGRGTNSKATHCLASPSGVPNAPQREDMCRTFQGASVIWIKNGDFLTLRKVFVMCSIQGCMRVWLHIIYTSTYNISAYIWCVYQLMPMSMCILTSWFCGKCYTMASPRLLEYTVRTEFPWAQMPQAWISCIFFSGASKLDWRRLQGYTIEN